MKLRIAAALGLLAASGLHAQETTEREYPLPPKDWPAPVMDSAVFSYLLLDRFEIRTRRGEDLRIWDAQGWVGGDHDKLWLKTEGERTAGGRTEQASIETLYARLISPFWYLQAGLRYEERPSPSRTALAFGIQGLAPYWFELDATAYVNQKGKFSARVEADYDLLLTQRLILQPSAASIFAGSAEPGRGVGYGFNSVELGLRLRYEIQRQFAPYIGVTWSRKLGDTADLARADGERTTEKAVVVGLRVWF